MKGINPIGDPAALIIACSKLMDLHHYLNSLSNLYINHMTAVLPAL